MTRERGEELANMFKDDLNQGDDFDNIIGGTLRGLKRGNKLPLEDMDDDDI